MKNEIGIKSETLMKKNFEIEKLRESAKNKSRFSKEAKDLKREEKEFQKVNKYNNGN